MTATSRTRGSGDAAFSIGVVCEADADRRIATELAERVLCSDIDWLDADAIGAYCGWCGLDDSRTHLAWKSVFDEARRRGIRAHGKFRSSPGACDARRATVALRLFMGLDRQPNALLMIRDTDDKPGHAESLRDFQESRVGQQTVVLGIAHPKREAWVLAGFDPAGSEEEQRLADARQRLGFDPRERSHELTAEGTKGKRNAKSTLDALTGKSHGREATCWQDTDLSILRHRGARNGLAEYLDEVSRLLTPLIGRSMGM